MEFVPNNESFTSMTTRNFVWGLIGIVFGLVINNLSKHFVDFFKIESKNIKILIQLLFCSIALSYVHTHINIFVSRFISVYACMSNMSLLYNWSPSVFSVHTNLHT